MRQTLLIAALSLTITAGADVRLVEDGKPAAEIVVAEKPGRMTKFAAKELQNHIEKMSGAKLPIVTKPSGETNRIFVGVSPYTEKLGLTIDGLDFGAYKMASGKDWVALIGPDKDFVPVEPWGKSRGRNETARVDKAWDEITGHKFRNPHYVTYQWKNKEMDLWLFDERGALNAVHQFLRDLGVRWYFPGELGEIIPEKKNISFPENVSKTVEPDYDLRAMTWWSQPWGVREDDALWRLRLGLHHQHDLLGIPQVCHGMKFVHGREEFQETHPECFALVGGKRDTSHKRHGAPCLSSPLMFDEHVAYARAVLDTFKEPVVNIDVVDGYSGRACECPLCAGKRTPERGAPGALSDYVWPYLNRVAEKIYESHPDRRVGGMSYGAYTLPPTTIDKMSPNLQVTLMSSRQNFDQAPRQAYFKKLIKDWLEKLPSDRLYEFENITYNQGDIPVFFTNQSADYLKATGDDLSGHYCSAYEHRPWKRDEMTYDALATAHLDLYLLSQLWWDRDADVDAMVDEYCELFYGPAKDEMRAFIDYCAENHSKMRNDVAAIGKALELIAAAEAKVKPDSVYGRRVKLVADCAKRLNALKEKLSQPRMGPEVRLAPRKTADLKLDGNLDDPFWKDVPEVKLRDHKTGEDPANPTTVRMAWGDNNSLYLAVRCEESDMESVLDTADGALGIFNGDNIDILIETPIVDFYQITVSPSGKILDMDRSCHGGNTRFNYKWKSDANVATQKGDGFWTAEIQIPAGGEVERDLDPNHYVAGDTPREDAPWYFNMGRYRPRGKDEPTFSSFAPARGKRFDDRFIRGKLVVE